MYKRQEEIIQVLGGSALEVLVEVHQVAVVSAAAASAEAAASAAEVLDADSNNRIVFIRSRAFRALLFYEV